MPVPELAPLSWQGARRTTFPSMGESSYIVIALVGNPNVGKSTLFNALTGLHQHTGNWPGKTVSFSHGVYRYKDKQFMLIDLPGIYSLQPGSPEEEITYEFLRRDDKLHIIVVVADATALERSLLLALQVINLGKKVILCINLMDEAKKRGWDIDIGVLSRELKIPVVATAARNREGLSKLQEAIYTLAGGFCTGKPEPCPITYPNQGCSKDGESTALSCSGKHLITQDIITLYQQAESLVKKATIKKSEACVSAWEGWLDNIIISKWTGLPLMILLLGVVLWVTLVGANYPSEFLSRVFFYLEQKLILAADYLNLPAWFGGVIVEGVYRTTAWVIAVMLPPMAIFFPCFTFLEELGYLPRVAFILDGLFKVAGTCGKQALTMGMGLGCNAAGVTACRIIDSPRERLIAMLTNVSIP